MQEMYLQLEKDMGLPFKPAKNPMAMHIAEFRNLFVDTAICHFGDMDTAYLVVNCLQNPMVVSFLKLKRLPIDLRAFESEPAPPNTFGALARHTPHYSEYEYIPLSFSTGANIALPSNINELCVLQSVRFQGRVAFTHHGPEPWSACS